MATVHDRILVILAPEHCMRWLGPELDPRNLMKPYPSDLMKICRSHMSGRETYPI
ncbi:SOS response-associated peptidase (plasmid) [Mesorhizobium sp. AR02]|uniref:hypothetical protein n=1 Tax=Mesorhizobium sp. AR02 TaxID=2865837 RepID=UPI002209A6B5|nr:hypothetical protein [Mesorhizobium sp. AR02]UVK57604.1 SOS response-associated peptidase [Mesorhizobium sp. AR02]